MKITRLGHAMLSIEYENLNILVDPFYSMNPGSVEEELKQYMESANVVLLTHGHFDHTEGLTFIKEVNPKVQVLAQYELALILLNEGFNVMPLNISGTMKAAETTVQMTMVPAVHTSSYQEIHGNPTYAGVSCGFILESNQEETVYISGDTGLTAEMKIIQDVYEPKVAILSCSDILTMGAREAEYAIRHLLDVHTVIPIHNFPTEEEAKRREVLDGLKQSFPIVPMMVRHDADLKERLKDHKTNVEIVGFGESIEL
ncbi:hypothetical protein AC623_09510 [Bacillus sp. FJAT-27231]|uniref:metal-dependent hydrolase n=1 Tax=Bacillus sp. FJAT-27231 TaxID=1679168 RepID=UPI0006713B3D|nr:metal-dependent hydrolase [Bacillus sp. FJAT-27231]KMY54140.1 hypothetical protein AC623_09510 [Bacillus sp. FJAT-27231]